MEVRIDSYLVDGGHSVVMILDSVLDLRHGVLGVVQTEGGRRPVGHAPVAPAHRARGRHVAVLRVRVVVLGRQRLGRRGGVLQDRLDVRERRRAGAEEVEDAQRCEGAGHGWVWLKG